jgi:hypothetical protein
VQGSERISEDEVRPKIINPVLIGVKEQVPGVMAQFEKFRVHDSVMLRLRSILRAADRQWRQLYRCAPDPSQAQDDAGSEPGSN